MKRFLSLLAIACILLAALSACSSYKSSYKAVLLVHSNTNHKAEMSFMEFEGSMVFELKCEDADSISWTAELESGDVTVYFDDGRGRTELFKAGDGASLRGESSDLDRGTVYIIVETNGKCKEGSFTFFVD